MPKTFDTRSTENLDALAEGPRTFNDPLLTMRLGVKGVIALKDALGQVTARKDLPEITRGPDIARQAEYFRAMAELKNAEWEREHGLSPQPAPSHPYVSGLDPSALGRSPTLYTDLPEQVGRYYEGVKGGIGTVASEAQRAMSDRSDWQESQMKGFPKYRPEDLERTIPVFRGADTDEPRVAGLSYSDKDAVEVNIPSEFLPKPGSPYLTMPEPGSKEALRHLSGYGMPIFRHGGGLISSGGEGFMDAFLGSEPYVQGTLEHELGHQAFQPRPGQPGYDPEFSLVDWSTPAPRPGSGGLPDYFDGGVESWDYATSPAELDPRIAEIKRVYSRAHPGRYVRTIEDARKAWDYWGKMQRTMKEKQRMGGWEYNLWDQMNKRPRDLNLILQRMREVVSNQPGGLADALIG